MLAPTWDPAAVQVEAAMMQCQVEGQDFSGPSTKFLAPQERKLIQTSWCQNLADMHSFPSMYDMHRQHTSNVDENYV